MNKNKIIETINRIFYSNLEYPVCGNREILASNKLLDNFGINDIDMIYELAKTMESVSDIDMKDKDYDTIYKKSGELLKEYRTKTIF
jgi:hypothetical protein